MVASFEIRVFNTHILHSLKPERHLRGDPYGMSSLDHSSRHVEVDGLEDGEDWRCCIAWWLLEKLYLYPSMRSGLAGLCNFHVAFPSFILEND
jgi:hypothetical protein